MTESQKNVPELGLIDEVGKRLSEYFRVFLDTHPLNCRSKRHPGKLAELDELDYSDVCRLGIPLQASILALGKPALDRFMTLGLDILVPADNPVDWFEWILKTREEEINFTVQASIVVRFEGELARMRDLAEGGHFARYRELDATTFLVSKARYQQRAAAKTALPAETAQLQPTHATIVVVKADDQAWDTLGESEKPASFGSNVAKMIATWLPFRRKKDR